MNTYDELYGALLKLCQNDGLKLEKRKYQNKNTAFLMKKNKVVINTNYQKFKSKK